MNDKPPLLFHSNAPWAGTGYANQTALFAPRLNETYRLGISAFYGCEGSILPWKGIPVYPGIGQTHGNEAILDHCAVHHNDLRGGLVMTLMDVWVLDPAVWKQMDVCSWVPIDHEPAPPPIVDFFYSSGAIPIAMSRYGQEKLTDAGLEPLYVPHAVDRSVFRPKPRAEARKQVGFAADAFVVGMVAANKGNPSRKCFVEAFQAFKALHDKHSEARLYLHTEAHGRFDGVNLPGLIHQLGLDSDSVIFCDQYRAVHFPFEAEHMARLYSAMDVLLMPSRGEGFGIPALEAQSCGTPVIGSDFSAQPEVIGSGWLVGGRPHYTPLKAWQFDPNVEEILDALEQAYDRSAAERRESKRQAIEHAEGYDIETVMAEHMLPALAEVEQRLSDREPELVAA